MRSTGSARIPSKSIEERAAGTLTSRRTGRNWQAAGNYWRYQKELYAAGMDIPAGSRWVQTREGLILTAYQGGGGGTKIGEQILELAHQIVPSTCGYGDQHACFKQAETVRHGELIDMMGAAAMARAFAGSGSLVAGSKASVEAGYAAARRAAYDEYQAQQSALTGKNLVSLRELPSYPRSRWNARVPTLPGFHTRGTG